VTEVAWLVYGDTMNDMQVLDRNPPVLCSGLKHLQSMWPHSHPPSLPPSACCHSSLDNFGANPHCQVRWLNW